MKNDEAQSSHGMATDEKAKETKRNVSKSKTARNVLNLDESKLDLKFII